ncbi:MAG TPA: DUF308 domain-containing protein [Nitrososphaerales archaeon]|nr:DUF308 domain-containing protein [Nitrososphaerales archaeon]
MSGEQEAESAQTEAPPNWFRALEVVLGLATVVVSVVILANPNYQTEDLVVLLSVALLFSAVRIIATGGLKKRLAGLERLGLLGAGLLATVVLLLVIFLPGLSYQTFVFLFAISLTAQGLGRIIPSTRRIEPRWLRGSAFATGALAIVLAAVAVLVPNIAALTLVPLFSVVVLMSGIEMIVWGLRPTDPRQLTLLKLILFSAFYGLVLVNWIDLFATSAPAYHIWLILTYMAPFGVLIVFQGLKDWQLALSLGLLVSLMNDVGYYFIGDLLFGFHQALVPWVEGQLGLLGPQLLFTFQGGAFTIPVTSTLMGISIYARVVVVALILYHWWRHPTKITQLS